MDIAHIKFRNSFLMSAVKTGYGDEGGNITGRHLAFWERRSRHVAAVILEPFFINKKVRELPNQIGIDNDFKIKGHKNLVDVIHRNGAKAIAHINHPGRMANPKMQGNVYISASEIECPNGGQKPKSVSIEEIKSVQRQYIEAALRAEKAGYDLIELQFGLGYLIAQFLSPVTNNRNDEYGGEFENRLRFGIEIIRGIKKEISLPLIVRISGDEKFSGGLTIDDSIQIVKQLEKEKADAVHVAAGNVCESPAWYYQHFFIPKVVTWQLAKKIKEQTLLPVIGVGQITEPADIAAFFNEEIADYIAIGRALIADPDFIGKYLQLVEGRIRPCSSCLTGCLRRIKMGKGLQCQINPEVGRESEPLVRADEKKNYTVVGGGMAGMEAAITLRQRGHKVTLFEKKELGGQFNLAPVSTQKKSLQKQIDYLKNELGSIQVIKKEVKPEDILGRYDGVILATGSKPLIPPVEGLTEYRCDEILTGKNIPQNKSVLIIGGGSAGIEIANTLVDYGNKIIIIEKLDDIAVDMETITRNLILQKLRGDGVTLYTNTKVERIAGSSAFLKSRNVFNGLRIDDIDIYVAAAGRCSEKELYNQLENKIPAYLVGDALEVGDAASAIQSAYFTCKEL
jgi:2,4-dienoyl-CoA reductase-like NADH-dependent reductase (Old Yellow Enzyme family)/thioredoxin reductase